MVLYPIVQIVFHALTGDLEVNQWASVIIVYPSQICYIVFSIRLMKMDKTLIDFLQKRKWYIIVFLVLVGINCGFWTQIKHHHVLHKYRIYLLFFRFVNFFLLPIVGWSVSDNEVSYFQQKCLQNELYNDNIVVDLKKICGDLSYDFLERSERLKYVLQPIFPYVFVRLITFSKIVFQLRYLDDFTFWITDMIQTCLILVVFYELGQVSSKIQKTIKKNDKDNSDRVFLAEIQQIRFHVIFPGGKVKIDVNSWILSILIPLCVRWLKVLVDWPSTD